MSASFDYNGRYSESVSRKSGTRAGTATALDATIGTVQPEVSKNATAGYILAGGLSSRMGENKALLRVNGVPLIKRVASVIADAAACVTVVGGDSAAYEHLGLRCIPDGELGRGPLNGIATALRDSSHECAFITACDMPGLTTQTIEELQRNAVPNADVIVYVHADGSVEPLCALWRREASQAVESMVGAGIRSVHEALRYLRTHTLLISSPAVFTNINTPGDWTAFLDA